MRDDIDLGHIELRLKQRLKEITAAMETGKDRTAPVELDQARLGRVSRMDAMQQRAMARAAASLSGMEKARIQTALDRIKTGDFGFCTNCDEEIAEKRLQFDPSVMLCIDCARAAEGQ